MEFKIGDIVEWKDQPSDSVFIVTGVIHDDEMLFITDKTELFNDGIEFGIPFDEITRCWREISLNF